MNCTLRYFSNKRTCLQIAYNMNKEKTGIRTDYLNKTMEIKKFK